MSAHNHRCLIIYNPISGKGIDSKTLNAYYDILIQKGFKVDFVTTKYSRHATEIVANADDYDLVFSIGGDGTLNEVVRGNFKRHKQLTICPLPSGTCNDVASMYGYSKNPLKNLKMALDGEVHEVDIGTINDEPFTYVVGVGQFMNIPYETKREDKKRQGYLAYIKGAISEIINKIKRYKAEVIIDGVKLDGYYSLIMVSNANHIAGINNFYHDVCLDDGEMEVLLCKSKNKRELIASFLSFILGQKNADIISLKAHELSVKMLDQPEKNWCVDGEELTDKGTEFNIRVRSTMRFLTPKLKTKKLFRKPNRLSY